MAFVHKRRNANTRRRALLRLGVALCALVPFALAAWYGAALLMKKQPPAALGWAVLAAAAVCALAARWMAARAAILASGLSGERKAVAVLRSLPNEYQILANPVLSVHGQTAELDAAVIGKNGVFLVETKNHSGVIAGKADAEWWSQKKRSGAKRMKNPLLQIERQQRIVERALEEASCSCPVRAMVYFANPNARVSVRDPRIYTGADALRRAILNTPRPKTPVEPTRALDALDQACGHP